MGHNSSDSTAIEAREKPLKKASIQKIAAKRGGPKQGEERIKPSTRIDKQASGMGLADMLKDLPKACDVGTKKNSKDFKVSWIGYKLHKDVAEDGIPISAVLTSASTPCGRRDADRQYHLRRRAQLPSEFLSTRPER